MSSIARQCTTLLRVPSLKTAIFELYWAVLVHDFINFVQVLPGFEQIGGAQHLHQPCNQRELTLRAEPQDEAWLRHLIYRLVRRGQVVKLREKRPDLRQARGWDWMSCLYPTEKGVMPDE